MAGPHHPLGAEVDPAEMAQGPPLLILAVTGDAGGIEVGRATTVPQKSDALPLLATQGVVQMAEHHQGNPSPGPDAFEGQGEVMVPPVAGLSLPVTTARVAGLTAQAGGTAMGQEHQREVRIGGQGSPLDAAGRILQVHRAENGRGGLGEMVPPTGGGGAATHHRQAGGGEGAQRPAAMEIPEQLQLVTQAAPAGVSTGVVVAQHTGQGKAELAQQARNTGPAVAHVTHHQQGIGTDLRQHRMVAVIPLIMEVTSDGDLQHAQRLPSLGWSHPARPEARLSIASSLQAQAPHRPLAHSAEPLVPPDPADLPAAIKDLRQQRNAVILAHYYQEDAIQDIADVIGDSLELARRAASTEADVIVFCGVHFMAETAKILNPGRIVVLPDLEAGCSLADACPAEAFAAFRALHSDHYVVSYINCSAAVKAQSDLICTSSNAVQLVQQLPADRPILFAPDANLGRWVARQSGRELTLWPGSCIVHETFSEQALLELKLEHPEAEVIAHPECQQHLLDLADFIGSTSKLLQRVQSSEAPGFIVLTEPGILHQMQRRMPQKAYYSVPGSDGCSCNACPYMRLNTMEKLWHCLATLEPRIELDEELRLRALAPIERMLAMSA